eukprot:CAMPEP_0184857026 /NCGR_PEP_ID=MMETSP0580-20130426/2196_1 /TAXON_ID=1118495 /ORGANISM="Dactyliosolen fragilissimus" /LENGTH=698 /DNA_ID=CAMNT_0027352385 /DNA_START=143 /DNA_END=2239 /DNA_ORIENTATION=+
MARGKKEWEEAMALNVKAEDAIRAIEMLSFQQTPPSTNKFSTNIIRSEGDRRNGQPPRSGEYKSSIKKKHRKNQRSNSLPRESTARIAFLRRTRRDQLDSRKPGNSSSIAASSRPRSFDSKKCGMHYKGIVDEHDHMEETIEFFHPEETLSNFLQNNDNNVSNGGIRKNMSPSGRMKKNNGHHHTHGKNAKKLDEFGFIVNLDSRGQLRDEEHFHLVGGAFTRSRDPSLDNTNDKLENDTNLIVKQTKGINPMLSPNAKKTKTSQKEEKRRLLLLKRREKKWLIMLREWETYSRTKIGRKKLRSRIRKGIPNAVRGRAWAQLGNVQKNIDGDCKGQYSALVRRSLHTSSSVIDKDQQNDSETSSWLESDVVMNDIERDLNRTFPRHAMFYDSGSDDDTDLGTTEKDDDASFDILSCDTSIQSHLEPHRSKSFETSDVSLVEEIEVDASGREWTGIIHNSTSPNRKPNDTPRKGVGESGGSVVEIDFKSAEGGQAKLRRVLRAYSHYDKEVAYCQGMNYIAAMFITYMEEEKAFWLFVAVMNDKPCKTRHMFDKTMSGSHEKFYITERLIAQFNPKLHRHLKNENIMVEMFLSDWIVTLFTRSFPFSAVTRVWDCFLYEGWKVIYRVVLALLDISTNDLLKMKFESILAYFKDLPKKVDGGTILDAAFKIPIKTRHITKHMKTYIAKLNSNDESGRKKR